MGEKSFPAQRFRKSFGPPATAWAPSPATCHLVTASSRFTESPPIDQSPKSTQSPRLATFESIRRRPNPGAATPGRPNASTSLDRFRDLARLKGLVPSPPVSRSMVRGSRPLRPKTRRGIRGVDPDAPQRTGRRPSMPLEEALCSPGIPVPPAERDVTSCKWEDSPRSGFRCQASCRAGKPWRTIPRQEARIPRRPRTVF